MSRAEITRRNRPFWPTSYVALLLFILISTTLTTVRRVGASPLPDPTQGYENSTSGGSTESSSESLTDISRDNSREIVSNTDVYVVKAVVYEIGILTDVADNATSSESTESQGSIDISLYTAPQEDEFF